AEDGIRDKLVTGVQTCALPISVAELLVVCDDINLPLGKLRVRARGTHGGHNGLRDIQLHLGTTDYARLRIGVDAPESEDAVGHRSEERRVGKEARSWLVAETRR